jgi:transcriptional regulator with XRE-family HTH domain
MIKGLNFNIKKFRRLVKSRGQSFTFIAKRAGISRSHLNFIMMGYRSPSKRVLIKIAEAMDVERDWLVK